MALKAYTEKALGSILERFNVPKDDYRFQAVPNGLINDTFLAHSKSGISYVVQRINTTVFPNVSDLMKNMERALFFLQDSAYPGPTFLRTPEHRNFIIHKALGHWRAMVYVSESTTFNTTKKPEIAFECGKLIANFHQQLRHADLSTFTNTIPNFHHLPLRVNQFENSLTGARPDRLKSAEEAIAFAQETIKTLVAAIPQNLPQRVCHNDTKLNNILFSKKTGKALCLIDLDTVMKGYFHFDFGDAIRTIVNSAPEDERNHSLITLDLELFQAFVNGVAYHGPFLNDSEIKAAPFGVALMPFLHGLRALTDYLNNDIYYKTKYEGQNLDRCRGLFYFTAKALSQMKEMSQIVALKLAPL